MDNEGPAKMGGDRSMVHSGERRFSAGEIQSIDSLDDGLEGGRCMVVAMNDYHSDRQTALHVIGTRGTPFLGI